MAGQVRLQPACRTQVQLRLPPVQVHTGRSYYSYPVSTILSTSALYCVVLLEMATVHNRVSVSTCTIVLYTLSDILIFYLIGWLQTGVQPYILPTDLSVLG